MSISQFHILFDNAKNHANFGRNSLFLQVCEEISNQYPQNAQVFAQLSSLLLQYGFINQAKRHIIRAINIATCNKQLLLRLANIELQLGNIQEYQTISNNLLKSFPNCLNVLSTIIYFSEYLSGSSGFDFLDLPKRWGTLAILAAGGERGRPSLRRNLDRPVRIGYVSADFCQHTVGLLIKEVLANHNPKQFTIFAYSNGNVKDWVTAAIAQRSFLIDVTALSDLELAKRIERDHIDVLIDLSGHTGGSRLAAFAYRPAPIMISMLGYYSTTGLKYFDATLLDDWHASKSSADQFVEPIISLPKGRWCYYPAFPAPFISPPPVIRNGYITFGSFNNTLKYNTNVYKLWSKILLSTPNSRLILKWRTFNDDQFKLFVLSQFSKFGVCSARIELRGPSFHMKMLEEYSDIDIALDPFPFSGGVTSCEALYMGVPVITWPQDKAVSRQTYAFLSNIGHPELIALHEEEYLRNAVDLAINPKRLMLYRQTLRDAMLSSPLMQPAQFTKSLEETLIEILDKAQHSES